MALILKTSILITGKLTERNPLNPALSTVWVYQRVKRGLGIRRYSATRDIQRRRHVPQQDPKTQYQLAIRNRLRQATAAWHVLTPAEQQAFREIAKKLKHTGFNEHIRRWCRAHPLDKASYQGVSLGRKHGHDLNGHKRGQPYRGVYLGTLPGKDLNADKRGQPYRGVDLGTLPGKDLNAEKRGTRPPPAPVGLTNARNNWPLAQFPRNPPVWQPGQTFPVHKWR